MRRTAFIATTAMIALACGAAQAQEWVAVATYSDGLAVLIDVSRLKIDAHLREAWFKTDYSHRNKKGTGANESKRVDYELSSELFDCVRQRRAVTSRTVYYDDGSKQDANLRQPAEWQIIQLGSPVEEQLNFICAWKPK